MNNAPSDPYPKTSSPPPWSGLLLRAVRESRGLSLEAISESTRIRRGMIEWIENDAFDQLPAPVYTRGLIIQIAKALGLPEDEVALSYTERMKTP
jgi:cytoskeletal protein RodZ